jgi:two-component system, NtrC family, response regulator AtoC
VWYALQAHDWTGNVRELRNAIERCVLLSDTSTLAAQWLQLEPSNAVAQARGNSSDIILPVDGSLTLDEMEKRILFAALERTHYNVTAAARLLGTSRETLRYRVTKYGLELKD